ncbi:MAG TPA: aldo/keto reductase, partial [Myxococcales bacterium]|nr:aldo/keto reductase [Myxococcales bacterium]
NLVDWKVHLETLAGWKQAGRVRYVGVTHYSLGAFEQLEQIIRSKKVDFVQLPYSVAVRSAQERLLPAAAEHGVAVIVMRPFEGGTLFQKLRGTPLPPWAADLDCASWAQLFLKFILGHPAVTCVIPATSKPHHLQDNMGAGAGRLPTEAQRRQIAGLVAR